MIQIIFKNLDKSDLIKSTVQYRVEGLVEKFPDLAQSKIQITLEMLNSPHQPGPDEFSVSLHVYGGRYQGLHLQKSSANLHVALAEVIEHSLEKLNRFGDRIRVKQRRSARRLARFALTS